jgi:Fe2+ transport system protein FeoA
LPGDSVELLQAAPFGDPIAVRVNQVKFAMRLRDARKVRIRIDS